VYCFRLSGSRADGAAVTVLTGHEPEPCPLPAPYCEADVELVLSNNHSGLGQSALPVVSERAALDQ
jgi:hypothetical protein